jgi:hypothetical protein
MSWDEIIPLQRYCQNPRQIVPMQAAWRWKMKNSYVILLTCIIGGGTTVPVTLELLFTTLQ